MSELGTKGPLHLVLKVWFCGYYHATVTRDLLFAFAVTLEAKRPIDAVAM